jgi:hypothetical protein
VWHISSTQSFGCSKALAGGEFQLLQSFSTQQRAGAAMADDRSFSAAHVSNAPKWMCRYGWLTGKKHEQTALVELFNAKHATASVKLFNACPIDYESS